MSVNRASEVWKEIKPFAIRDMNRMLDNKAGDSGDDLYAIILYDESAQKIKYYSMSREGLDAALLSASSGDIIVIPAGEIGESEASVIPSLASNTKVLDLGTGNSGNDPPAGWNEVVFDDSEWETPQIVSSSTVDIEGAETLWSSQTINYTRAAFRHVFFLTDFDQVELTWDGDDRTNGVYVNGTLVDQWLSATGGDDHPPRTVDITNLLNSHGNNVVCIDQYDQQSSENPPCKVAWIISINPSSKITVPSGVEIAGLGKNSIFDTNVENNGILTNIQVTGTISGSGISRMVPNPTVEVFGNQIKSMVETGTSPFSIASTTVNDNLNADLLDGKHASAFADASHSHTESDITDLDHDAEKIDGIDVDLADIEDGETLVYDAYENKLIPGVGGGTFSVSDLVDVDLTSLADGDILVFDETSGDWLPETPAAGITVEELDESPSVSNVTKIILPNGSIVGSSGGVVTIEFPEGEGSAGATDVLMVQVFS